MHTVVEISKQANCFGDEVLNGELVSCRVSTFIGFFNVNMVAYMSKQANWFDKVLMASCRVLSDLNLHLPVRVTKQCLFVNTLATCGDTLGS